MAEPSLSGNNISSDHLQTWILKVYIHCEGCKKKVFKVLQSIDGVYKTVIDSKQHKATVTGSVNGETLVQKLLKSGKHAEILPESFGPPAAAKSENDTGSQKKKKKQNNKNKQNDQVDDDDDTEHIEIEESEFKDVMNDENDSKNDQEIVELPVFDGDGDRNGKGKGGGKKKKKKNKNKKGNNNNNNNSENKAPQNGDIENDLESSMEKLNMDTPSNQTAYATPYDVPAYHNYYPIPAYGMSYNTSYPSTESSYYTPVYGYAQSHPSGFNSVRPPISYYGRSAFDDDVIDEGGDRRFCVVM